MLFEIKERKQKSDKMKKLIRVYLNESVQCDVLQKYLCKKPSSRKKLFGGERSLKIEPQLALVMSGQVWTS